LVGGSRAKKGFRDNHINLVVKGGQKKRKERAGNANSTCPGATNLGIDASEQWRKSEKSENSPVDKKRRPDRLRFTVLVRGWLLVGGGEKIGGKENLMEAWGGERHIQREWS